MPYHHGDLRRAMLDAASEAILESGPSALSLRELARRAGVSNAAPTHHFGDKAGLFTALATEGYALLAETVEQAWESGGGIIEMGVRYVSFALEHRAHFEVMFQPGLLHAEDEKLIAARVRALQALQRGVAADPRCGPDSGLAGTAAWSLVHGFATLVLSGVVRVDDAGATTRAIAGLLFPERA
ncbi:TetR/AcrR family transcriptional regulator [Sciscionella sediminilitoris]|uniref:TetR/AcrR family transcriptional regulator n=1 Tax=Sciscionella sediminilitoris TaxID=1445613 RepID=UPI0004DEEA6F|nr:TetR/AcrR family transcriptional regulator [Sciscionella sp. SE31]